MKADSPFTKVIKVHVRVQATSLTTQSTPEQLAVRAPKILIVGVGGTGGWVVPHVARMVKSLGVGSLAIADGDLVETKNLGRQNFVAADLGVNKALALAKRYSGAFGIPIRAIPGFLEDTRGLERQSPNVIIGCVDKHKARRMIAEYMARTHECVWIDSGNETVAGQVVMGYTGTQFRSGMRASGPIAAALPTISQMLDLPVGGEVRPGCAEMQEVTTQVSSVNVWAASICANFCRLVLEDVKRCALHEPVKGVSHHGIYFNCENGGFSTLWNTPEALQKARAPMCPWNMR